MQDDKRTRWVADDLGIENEPLILSLIKYRQKRNRRQVFEVNMDFEPTEYEEEPNLISSLTYSGTHMPILDMDFPHHFEKSTTDGHTHLYLDVEMSKWKLFLLVWVLYYVGIIEMGAMVWTIRRGANFVRLPGVKKQGERETRKPDYGWFFRLKGAKK